MHNYNFNNNNPKLEKRMHFKKRLQLIQPLNKFNKN